MGDWTALRIFNALTDPVRASSVGMLAIKIVDKNRKLAIGFTSEGVAIFAAPQSTKMTSFRTASLELLVDQELDLEEFKGTKLFILRFETREEELVLAVASVLAGFVQLYDTGKFEEAVLSLKLFLRQATEVDQQTIKTQIGLAGELAFILRHPAPGSAVRAWHFDPTGTYDFGFGSSRVEVKSTLRPIRKHWLKYSQFGPSQHNGLFLASVYTGVVEAGYTISDIVDRVRSELNPSEISEFESKLSNYEVEKFSLRFDLESAISEIRFFDASTISVPQILDDSILDLHWQIDFDRQVPLPEFPFLS